MSDVDEFERLMDEALAESMRMASTRTRVPWTDKPITVLRDVFAQVEASRTEEQREALTAAMSVMTPEDWIAFAAAMIRPAQPEDLLEDD
jgi:CubicO group peptidase (beta-lactamase class C family)